MRPEVEARAAIQQPQCHDLDGIPARRQSADGEFGVAIRFTQTAHGYGRFPVAAAAASEVADLLTPLFGTEMLAQTRQRFSSNGSTVLVKFCTQPPAGSP